MPFRPRATDHWKVGGRSPRALPAGRVSGRAMRTLDVVPAAGSLDGPLTAPGSTTTAVAASWDAADGTSDVELTAAVDPGGLKREVFGFLPYWELTDSSTRLDWEKISTVAFFGVGAAADGNLQKRNSDGSTTVGWSGWTSSKMTSVINAAHTSGARVVLTVQSFAWSTSGATRQKALLGSSTARAKLASQIAAAVRDRGADGVNLDFEPIASGYGDEFTALVRKVRSTLERDRQGLPAHVRYDRLDRQLPDRGRHGGRRRRRDHGHGLRLPHVGRVGRRFDRPAQRVDLRHQRHRRRLPRPGAGLEGHPRRALLRSRLVDEDVVAARDEHLGHQVRRRRRPPSTRRRASWRRTTAASTTRPRAWPGRPTSARPARRPTAASTAWRQLYYDDATALKAKYDLVNSRGLRGVGHLGPRLRRDPHGAVFRAQGQVHHRRRAADDQHAAR